MTLSTTPRYIPCAETAKLVRHALRESFPGVKFSVRSSTYSGGASINVSWTDGPLTRAVESIAKAFEGSQFDGMVDLKTGLTHYMRPDGRILLAHAPAKWGGTATDNRDLAPVLPSDVEAVRFGADFVFCQRNLSHHTDWANAAHAWIIQHCRIEITTGGHERFGDRWVSDIAQAMAYLHLEGEDWDDTFHRFNHPYD